MLEETKLQTIASDNNKIRNNKILIISIAILAVAIILTASFLISTFIKTNKDYSQGLLVINTNKSVYLTKDSVIFNIGSLDSKGKTLCKSNLEISIKTPSGQDIFLSTENGEIINSVFCSENNTPTNVADYQAKFVPNQEGTYNIKLTNKDTNKSINSKFLVQNNQVTAKNFLLQRSGTVRVNPSDKNRPHMRLLITPIEDFKGQVVEQIPSNLVIIWQGPSKITDEKKYKTITWDVDIKAGETKELIYEFQSPTNGIGYFSLGKAKILENENEVFEENRVWDIVVGESL